MSKSSKIARVKDAPGWPGQLRSLMNVLDVERWFDATDHEFLGHAIDEIGTQEATLQISTLLKIRQRYLEIPPNVTLQFLRSGSLQFDLDGTYEVTERSLDKLRELRIHDRVYAGLEKIVGRHYTTREEFMDSLEEAVGSKGSRHIARYERLILLYAQQILEINGEIQAGFHQIFQGGGTIIGALKNERVLPQWFGVTGDGERDDSRDLQKSLDTCAATGKTLYFSQDLSVRVTENLFVYGKFDIVGENTNAEIYLDADLHPGAPDDSPDNRRRYWINFGIPYKGANPVTYTGSVSNLQFKATEKARVHRMLFFHNAERFTVSGCYFDLRQMKKLCDCVGFHNNATPLTGSRSSTWCRPSMRKQGRILNNTCIAAQGQWGGEGIGMANATDIIIEGNFIYGFGDVVIGCKRVDRLTIAHNHCYSTDGRILFNNCTDVRVIGNYAERIASPVDGSWFGGGALMSAGIESRIEVEAPSRIVISGNQLYLPAEVPSPTYGIWLKGVRDAIVSNNQIRCDSPDALTGGIRIERDTSRADWTDSTGRDPVGVARPRNVHIVGNTCYGDYPQGIEIMGAENLGSYYIHGNVAGGYVCASANANFGQNSVIPALLFRAGEELQSDLENGTFSDASLKEFEEHGVPLSDTIAVSTEVEGNVWWINDGRQTYRVTGRSPYLEITEETLDKLGDAVPESLKTELKKIGWFPGERQLDSKLQEFVKGESEREDCKSTIMKHAARPLTIYGVLPEFRVTDLTIENLKRSGLVGWDKIEAKVEGKLGYKSPRRKGPFEKKLLAVLGDEIRDGIINEDETISLISKHSLVANPMRVSGNSVIASNLLFEGYSVGVKPSVEANVTRSGVPSGWNFASGFYIERPTRITFADIILDKTLAQRSRIKVRLSKNGRKLECKKAGQGCFWPDITKESGKHMRVISTLHDDFFTCCAGDYIEIKLLGNPSVPADGYNAVIRVHGISW